MTKRGNSFNYNAFHPNRRITFADISNLMELCDYRVLDIAWYLGAAHSLNGKFKRLELEVDDPIICMLVRFLCRNTYILTNPVRATLDYHPVDLVDLFKNHGIPADQRKIATLFAKNYNTVCGWYRKILPLDKELRTVGRRVGRDIERLCEMIVMTVEKDGMLAYSYWMDLATNEAKLRGNTSGAQGQGW